MKLFRDWKITSVILTIVLALVIMQLFGMLFGNMPINRGPVLLFALISISVLISAIIIRTKLDKKQVERKDFLILLVLIISIIIIMLYFQPETFSIASQSLKADLKSILPLP